jgi:hypothetical protein
LSIAAAPIELVLTDSRHCHGIPGRSQQADSLSRPGAGKEYELLEDHGGFCGVRA